MPDDPKRGSAVRGLSAASLIRKLDEGASPQALGRIIEEADPEVVQQAVGELPTADLQRVVEHLDPKIIEPVLATPAVAGRLDQINLPDVIRIPEAPRDLGWGFPFAQLPEDPAAEVAIVRPRDLVVMRVRFVGMERAGTAKPAMRPADDGPHLLVVTLPPQHLLEESFVLSAEGDLPKSVLDDLKIVERVRKADEPPSIRLRAGDAPDIHLPQPKDAEASVIPHLVVAPELAAGTKRLAGEVLARAVAKGAAPMSAPVRAQLAGRSRLVFAVPKDSDPIELTAEGILEAIGRLELRLPEAVARAKEPEPILAIDLVRRAGFELTAAEPGEAPSAASLVIGGRRLAAVRSGMLAQSSLLDLNVEPLRLMTEPVPALPADDETAIELPHRLIIAPDKGAAWVHSAGPAEVDDRVELWTSWLAGNRRTFRAVWTRDAGFADSLPVDMPPSDPFLSSLTTRQRGEIVRLSSDSTLEDDYLPVPVDAKALGLSALGAWLDAEGRWREDPPPAGFSLTMWRHRAAMGRDTDVKVAEVGYLLPFGHRAVLVTVTDRRFHGELEGNPAYLRTQYFVAIREPERQHGTSGLVYEGGDETRAGARFDLQCPLTRTRILTKVTPALDQPKGENGQEGVFWPKIGGEPFRFAMQAVDHEGRQIEFRMPLLFADHGYLSAHHDEATRFVAGVYDGGAASDTASGGAPAEWRTLAADGSLVAFADPGKPDDTAYATQSIEWGLGAPRTKAAFDRIGPPYFAPVALAADIEVPALQQFAPEAARMRVGYHAGFLKDDFGTGEVFLEAASPVDLSFDAQGKTSGGFLTPNFAITGLSRKLGPVGGDLGEFAGGKLDYAKIFERLGAKLFGAINLWDILDSAVDIDSAVPKIVGQAMDAAQAFITALEQLKTDAAAAQVELEALSGKIDETIAAVKGILAGETADLDALLSELASQVATVAQRELASQDAAVRRVARRADQVRRQLEDVAAFAAKLEGLAKGVELAATGHAKLEWNPQLQAYPPDGPVFKPNKERGLTLAVEVAPDLSGTGFPESSVSCTLVDFDLDLGPVRLHFEKLEVSIEPGQKPDVDVVLGEMRFEDELEFVQTLTEILPLDGFSDPPDLTVTEEGITASFSTGIPSVSVGVLSLQDLSLSASCRVPFIGSTPLSFRFDFCEAKRPAVLTVGMFGGGAYFGVEVSPLGEHKLVALRGAFEFGAGAAIDFGVASGSILVRAGIYFEVRSDGGVSLTGYFRLRGEVDVLGLISASIELRLELTYDAGKLRGRATLEIEVEIAWFSTTVSLECERVFAGGNADPTFYEVMRPELEFDPWPEYCGAFA